MDVRRSRTKKPDKWLATCPDFSRPLCEELRELVFRWEPDLTESVNTNMLCYSGVKRVCSIGAFLKKACLTFFRGSELPDPAGLFNAGLENHSIRNIEITSLDDLDRDALKALLRAAVKLDASPDTPPPPPNKREPFPMPDHLGAALKMNPKAAAFFESLKPTYQREYIVWNTFVKLQETKDKRLAETIEALNKGRKWAQRKG
ncbi:MAG: hypothetical protein JWO08_795 [Verrucomicrobiaceae bacterium]|nr:hypothetical protein [Verrucomicrobiaceae bacterium]